MPQITPSAWFDDIHPRHDDVMTTDIIVSSHNSRNHTESGHHPGTNDNHLYIQWRPFIARFIIANIL